jgi:hypothetical protein
VKTGAKIGVKIAARTVTRIAAQRTIEALPVTDSRVPRTIERRNKVKSPSS